MHNIVLDSTHTHRRKFGEITGGAAHYISHCTYIGTTVLESLAIIHFNKTIYKV